MGKMDQKEMLAISIIAIIFSPFILVGRALRGIGESLGIVEKEKAEYDPKQDPNYVAPTVETKPSPVNNTTGEVTHKPQIGQGFDNPNKLDPNS